MRVRPAVPLVGARSGRAASREAGKGPAAPARPQARVRPRGAHPATPSQSEGESEDASDDGSPRARASDRARAQARQRRSREAAEAADALCARLAAALADARAERARAERAEAALAAERAQRREEAVRLASPGEGVVQRMVALAQALMDEVAAHARDVRALAGAERQLDEARAALVGAQLASDLRELPAEAHKHIAPLGALLASARASAREANARLAASRDEHARVLDALATERSRACALECAAAERAGALARMAPALDRYGRDARVFPRVCECPPQPTCGLSACKRERARTRPPWRTVEPTLTAPARGQGATTRRCCGPDVII